MADKESRVTLRWQVDQSGLNQVKSSVGSIINLLREVGGEAADSSVSVKKLTETAKAVGRASDIQALAKEYARYGQIIEDDTKALRQMARALKEVGATSKEIKQAKSVFAEETASVRGGGARGDLSLGRAESLIGRTGSALRGLGAGPVADIVSGSADVLQLAGSVKELRGAVGGLPDILGNLRQAAQGLPGILGNAATKAAEAAAPLGASASALAAVATVAAPVAIGVGAVAVGLKLLGDAAQASKDNLDAALKAQVTFYTQLYALTSAQAQEQIELEERKQKSLARAIEGIQKGIAAAEKQLNESGEGVNVEAVAKLKVFNDQLKVFQGLADESKNNVNNLNNGFKDGTFAANDLAEAEKRLKDVRISAIDLEGRSAKRTADLIRNGTPEQIRGQLRDKKADEAIDQNTLVALAAELGPNHPTVEAARKNLAELRADIKSLEIALPIVTQRERERRGIITGLTDDLQRGNDLEGERADALEKEIEFLEKAGEAVNAFAEEAEALDAARKLSAKREGQDFSIKRLRDQTDFARRQAEGDAAHFKERAKTIAAFNREIANDENAVLKERAKEVEIANLEQIRAAEDYARAIKGIQNDIGDAAANLDAIGVRNAKRRLSEAQEQYGVESRRRKEDTDRKIKDLVESAEDERKLRLEAFKQELADTEEQYATERQRDQDAFRQQLQREDEDRALRLQRQAEANIRQDAERKKAFDRSIENLRKQLLEPEEKMKADSQARQRKDLKAALDLVEGDIKSFKSRVAGPVDTSRSSAMTVAANASVRSVNDSFTRRFGHGGSFGAGDFGVVGDRGLELIQFGAAGRVFSPEQSRQMLNGKTYNLSMGDVYLNGDPAPRELDAQVRAILERAFDEMSNG